MDHDISFRPGIGADGSDTYTPRTLIYDLKGAFGTLRRENALYELQRQDEPNRSGPWNGSAISLQLPPIAPSAYQQALDQGLDPPQLTPETVRFWSDYNHLFYHPRSIVQLNEYEINSSLMPFEKWQTGEELFSNLDREYDLLDRDLRPFLEECDQLQALQIFTSIDDAWGGFSARYLERLSDELGKGYRWVFGLNDGKQSVRERQFLQAANLAQTIYAVDSTASLHISVTSLPASLPGYVTINGSSPWHTSALGAIAVESITLPSRLRTSELGRATFDQLEATLNNDGHRRIVTAAMSLDDPVHLQDQLDENTIRDARMTNGIDEDYVEEHHKLDINMFPNMRSLTTASGSRLARRAHLFSKIESLRGQWRSDAEVEQAHERARDPFASGPRISVHQSQLLFPLLPSYPHIFRFAGRPETLAVNASLSTSTAVAEQIRELESTARRLIGTDEREALCDGLESIAEEYTAGWSGSDGSDDDD